VTIPRKLGFLEDTSQLDELVPRLRSALLNSTGGSGKASDVNFSRLQAELDAISRENLLQFSTPPFFTVIIRSLTILEGIALSADPRFRLVRGSYPYVLRQLLVPEDDDIPVALQKLLIRLLTVNGEGKEIEWERYVLEYSLSCSISSSLQKSYTKSLIKLFFIAIIY